MPSMLNEASYPLYDQLRVLLVDDDARYLMLCKRYLDRVETCAFQIDTAENVEDALGKCLSADYDCLVVDFTLPDGTGTGFIEALSENGSKTPPPAIITTADGGEEAATEAIRAGAVDYLSKRNANSQSLSRSIFNAVDKFRMSESLKLRNAELSEANDSLLQNRSEIMRFYHTVSHEVKTPLAAAREFVSLVRDGAGGEVSESQDELLKMAMDSCDQIKKQFTELLDMTRLESGKLELVKTAACVNTLATRSIASVSELARTKQVVVEQICCDSVEVFADTDRIVQVLSNLLHNAVKFSSENGLVVLRVQRNETDDGLEFRVEDSGIGISEEEQASVFKRLYQSEHQRSESSACGLGLGLAICKELVELHGSCLELTSEIGVGCTFNFTLPLVSVNN